MSPQIFLFLKRYQGTPSSLYLCSDEFCQYIKYIVQISVYCFQNIMDQQGIISIIRLSVQNHHPGPPKICDQHVARFIMLVARTVVLYNVKWYNGELRASRRPKYAEARNSSTGKKLDLLRHM